MKNFYNKTVFLTGRLLIFAQVCTDIKYAGVVIIPTIVFSKIPAVYNLNFQWLTFSLQLEYSRKNHQEE